MISYAQNREDVLLNRFFSGDPPQNYVDVGAGHPVFHSVTKHFYDIGWSGINIEPRQQLWEELSRSRTRDKNLRCAVSDKGGSRIFFEVHVPQDRSDDSGGLSTLDDQLAEGYVRKGFDVLQRSTDVQPLSEICNQHAISQIGFLKIDVEGHELNVIRSLDWNLWRPRIVVVEGTKPMTGDVCDHETKRFLEAENYIDANFDGLNRYFVRFEDADRVARLQRPVNVLDSFDTYDSIQLKDQIVELKRNLELLELQIAELNRKKQLDMEALNAEFMDQIQSLQGELLLQQTKARRRTLRGRWHQAGDILRSIYHNNTLGKAS